MVLISSHVLQMVASMLDLVSQAPMPSATPRQYSIIAAPVFHGATLEPNVMEVPVKSWRGHSKFLLCLGELLQKVAVDL